MLCVTLKSYTRACAPTTGGISDIVVFDPADFNFTQGAATGGVLPGYSAVALRSGAVPVGGTAAQAVLTVTALGVDGNTVTIKSKGVVIANAVAKTSAETTTSLMATKIINAINAGTGTHGYSAAAASLPAIMLTAPASLGASVNDPASVLEINDIGTLAVDVTQNFSGGVNGTANGAKMFIINFQQDEGEWTWKQTVKGCSVEYTHEFVFQLPDNSQNLSTFLQALDAASCCCGLGMMVKLNSGKIFVAGEKYVNASSITRFTLKHDGSDGGSGKVFGDPNAGNIHIKGTYGRNLYEFTGDWASIEALM